MIITKRRILLGIAWYAILYLPGFYISFILFFGSTNETEWKHKVMVTSQLWMPTLLGAAIYGFLKIFRASEKWLATSKLPINIKRLVPIFIFSAYIFCFIMLLNLISRIF